MDMEQEEEPLRVFPPVTSTNVRISTQNFLIFKPFATLV